MENVGKGHKSTPAVLLNHINNLVMGKTKASQIIAEEPLRTDPLTLRTEVDELLTDVQLKLKHEEDQQKRILWRHIRRHCQQYCDSE